MKIGHFDETEQNDDVDDVDDMDDADDMDDVDDMDDTEDMDDAEGDMDSPEDGKDADEGEDSGEEKMSIADKIKDKLSSMFKSKETDEGDETEEAGETDETDEGDDTEDTEDSGEDEQRPSWELSQEDKEAFNAKASEMAKEYREDHNLDEHGQKLDNGEDSTDDTEDPDAAKTHGDDGERVQEANQGAEIDDDELER